MESWHSEWIDQPEEIVTDLQSVTDLLLDEAPPESPTCSRGSNEGIEGECDTKNEKSEESVIKTNPTNVFLAKKRLQAYSKQVGKASIKEDKLIVTEGKPVKFQAKKTRKNLNSSNKAKTVIQEIEEIKRKELEDFNRRKAVSTAIRSISIHGAPSPDRSSTFKRRDQKQRNYRRSDTSNRYSPSIDVSSDRRGSYSSSREPRSWSEYRKSSITPRDEKFKSVSKKDILNLSLLEKVYNFDTPSPSIEPLIVECENGLKTVPVCNLKITKCRPRLVYSVNSEKNKDSFISREQLFHLVSSARKQAIKDVINKQSKPPPNNKTAQSQSWYNKMWRKSSNPECKILENSVGLSFLQTYSDEDDDNETEEIVICSSIRQKPINSLIPTVFSIQNDAVLDNKDLKVQRVAPEIIIQKSPVYDMIQDDTEMYTPEMSQSESILNKSEDETGVLTPEISSSSQLLKVTQVEEQTPEKRQLDSEQSDTQEKILKHKKNTKRTLEQPADEENKKNAKRKLEQPVDEEIPKPKKKKKVKKHDSYEDSDSSEEKRKKKKQKKAKNKEKISKKPKTISKKSKKKEISEVNAKKKKENKKERKKKKKALSVNVKSPIMDDLRKKLKRKAKKKASQKVEAPSKSKSSENLEISKKVKRKEKYKNNYSESDSESHVEPIRSLEIEIKKECDQNVHPVREKNTTPPDNSIIPSIVIKTEPVDEYFNENQKIPSQKTIEFNDNWESEEEEAQTIKPNLNSGWESDDEIYKVEDKHTETREDEKTKNDDAILDLEIPLNIKPFKKRDSQIYIPKKPLINIDPTDLETEKAKEIPNENQNVINTHVDSTPKKGRWDIKKSSSEELKTEHHALSVNASNIFEKDPSSSVTIHKVLENEYEEFMKAVSSKSTEALNVNRLSSIEIDINSTKLPETNQNVTEVIPQQTVVSARDIPFIPMPDEIKLQTTLEARAKIDQGITLNLPPSNRINVLISKPTITTPQLIQNETEYAQGGTPKKTQFSFTSLVLPTKKSLMDNSNLKLGDSDDENQKQMKSVLERRKEHLDYGQFDTAIHSIRNDSQFINPEPKKTAEPISERHRSRSRSPLRSSRSHDDKSKKRSPSPRRDSHRRRDSPPRRRGYSPKKDYSPRRRKSPDRYRDKSRQSPGRKYSSRRSHSPNYRKRTPSPRRRSPRRSVSPRDRSNKKSPRIKETSDRIEAETKRQTSSPLERLKRSVADSTISDDSLLPQPSVEEYTQSPIPLYFDRLKQAEMRKTLSDNNIQVKLAMRKEEFRPISTTYDNFYQNEFSQSSSFSTPIKSQAATTKLSNFVQVGNMVQIVPTDMEMKTDVISNIRPEIKSQILQVGNMLQIVPAEELPDLPPLPPSPKKEEIYIKPLPPVPTEKPSAETTLKLKIDERRTERDKRRKEREERRQEKENRRREKEKRRQIKMKQKTENMIKKALQLEVDSQDIKEPGMGELPTQWPPIHLSSSSKDSFNKSILVRGIRSSRSKRKVVQFADGVRPGEGTSPSAGEELSSLSPKVLPKEKRYTKTKMRLKHNKKKVKVKIIKPTDQNEENDEDNLPPPSPPPGSPPPHIFPPRIKAPPIVNHPPYVSNVVNQNTMFRTPPVNMLMMPQPTLADSPLQVHSYAQYPVPPLPPTKPPPLLANILGAPDSSSGSVHRNHHYNYSL